MKNNASVRHQTILGIDSWRGGIKYFLNLHPDFKRLGYKLVLLNFGSWGQDPGNPKYEVIHGMDVYDISFFETKSFVEILKHFNPGAILFFSLSSILHQSVNIYAIRLKIPTIHVFHGIVSVQSIETENLYQISLSNAFLTLSRAFWRNFTHVLPFFYKALYKAGYIRDSWNLPMQLIQRRVFFKNMLVSPYTKTDLGFVYISQDVDIMINAYGNKPSSVSVVGNLDLKEHNINEAEVAMLCSSSKPQSSSHRSNVIYLDTALYHEGIIFKMQSEYLDHLLATNDALRKQSLRLCIKLHPAWNASSLSSLLLEHGVKVLDALSTKTAILNAHSVLTEPTSLSILPAVLGAKVALASYGKLHTLQFGTLITSYPAAIHCCEISTYRDFMDNMRINTLHQLQWIETNKGPWPPHLFAHRVTTTVHEHLISTC
jgi:hypothetical protein